MNITPKKLAPCALIIIMISLFTPHTSMGVEKKNQKKHTKNKTYQTYSYKKKHAKGLRRDLSSRNMMKAMKHVSFLDERSPIPKKVDLSPVVSLPEDQGNCGACWDFSLSKALRSEYMIAQMDPGPLEFNYLLNNCGPGPKMHGCNGGSFSAARSFEGGSGPNLNTANPYKAFKGKCKSLPVKATALTFTMLGQPMTGPTFKDIAYAISVQKHMVSTDVAAGSGDWEGYSGGVYNDCQGSFSDIDHMIDIVGYNCQTSVDAQGNCLFDSTGRAVNHDELLLIENNWGENWGVKADNGHGGYMWMQMYGEDGSKCNAIATDALIFNINPTPTISVSSKPLP